MLALCIFLSLIITAVYSFVIFRKFETADDAMNAYRGSCTHALSHRIMKYTILVTAIFFAAWVVYNRHDFDEKSLMPLIYCSVAFIVTAADLFVLPSAHDTMARTCIFYFIKQKYGIAEGTVTDWFVDLDEEDYPEELEIDIIDNGNERCFMVDLEHKLIREEKTPR